MIEKILKEICIYKGNIIDVWKRKVRTADNVIAEREIVFSSSAVAIVPILPDNKICLVRQYRCAIKKILWEIPAGKLDPDEALIDCARRELKEETGYSARYLKKKISFYVSPGFANEMITVFIARGLKPGKQNTDKDENIEVGIFSVSEVKRMVRDGRIKDAKTIIGLSLI